MTPPEARTVYVCSECGTRYPRWEGRCARCGSWNTVREESRRTVSGVRGGRRPDRRAAPSGSQPVELSSLSATDGAGLRLSVGIAEVDRVLGGGLVPGSVVLLAGDPGIGKSTLLLQISEATARQHGTVLYASGEESPEQIRLRASRLGLSGKAVFLMTTDEAEAILERADDLSPRLLIVDSIQTMTTGGLPGAAGSVTQVRESARLLTAHAKATGAPLILAGHVTKDGGVAGPRVLEHTVDVVLQLDGEPGGVLRTLHGTKNRYGHTNEVGVFEMGSRGLTEVSDPSRSFLGRRAHGSEQTPGSAVATVIEGTRPITTEVQALTAPSAAQSPRRVATGIDQSRLHLILAVLARRLRLRAADQDVIVAAAGGLRLTETAADLPVALAIASSLLDVPVDPTLSAAGEIGLAGELRPVSQPARRISEARRLGFRGCIVPAGGAADSVNGGDALRPSTLAEAIGIALPGVAERLDYGSAAVARVPRARSRAPVIRG